VGLGAETRRVPCPDRDSVWADRGPRQKRRLKVVPLMTDPETITLRFIPIGGQRDELASARQRYRIVERSFPTAVCTENLNASVVVMESAQDGA
jgi:hypothetical protein